MISIHDIEREAYTPSIPKAYELFRNGNIGDLKIQKQDPLIYISARIKASQRIPYRMCATVNETTNRIIEYSCDCPANEEYSGLCKHCMAMLMTYIAKRDETQKDAIPTKQSLPITSNVVKKMLNHYITQ